MRKILNFRFFRLLVCLVLICCFLVNSSPIKAEAVVAEATAPLWVPAATVVAGVLIVIGIMAGADHTSFNDVVNNCVTWLTNTTSYVVNGMINVVGFVGADGITRSYVLKDMIQDIWGWSFDSGVVVSVPPSVAAGTSITFGSTTYTCTTAVQAFVVRANITGSSAKYHYLFVGGSSSFKVDDGTSVSSASYVKVNGVRVYYYSLSTFSPTSNDVLLAIDFSASRYDTVGYMVRALSEWFATGSDSVLLTSAYDGLTLGKIQAPTEEVQLEEAEVYTDYITKIEYFPDGQPDTGEDKKEHLPVGFPSTDLGDLLLSQTQEQTQSGDTNLDFDFETSTDPDPGAGEPGTGTDTDSGSSSWTPPSDYTQFQLVDLKNFFPFCIPFDLFEFFKLLNSDPVAPVLHWEIQDLAGQTYSLTVDLSEWDSVALLFRRLQLFLFVTGLAAASRKFIKW